MEDQEFVIPEINLDELGIERPGDSNEDTSEEIIENDDPSTDLDEEIDNNLDEEVSTEEEPIHAPVYNWMRDQGYFFNKSKDELKEIPETPEDFFNLIQEREKELLRNADSNAIQQLTSKVPEYLQKVVAAAIRSPEPIPQDTFMELVSVAEQTSIKEEDFDNDEFAEKYIREDYKDKGLDDDSIDDIIAALKDRDKLKSTAKSTYAKSNKGNEIIDKFVSTIDKKVEDVEQQNQQFQEEVIEAFNNTGWREDKVRTIQKAYSNGEVLKRLQSMINSPAAQPYLADFAMFWDGKKLHLDKYSKQAFSTVTKDIEDKINKRNNNYFKRSSKSSTKKKTNDPLKNLDLDNLELITKD